MSHEYLGVKLSYKNFEWLTLKHRLRHSWIEPRRRHCEKGRPEAKTGHPLRARVEQVVPVGACLDFAVCTESGIHVSLKPGAAGSGCACVIETCPLGFVRCDVAFWQQASL